ncbi:MAG: 50S ribosomal protein L11 methyltransferase [Balneolaceae bacterium]|nr:50S ribosomal protein L11 methyltransferase [Balneolaceae bacterium]
MLSSFHLKVKTHIKTTVSLLVLTTAVLVSTSGAQDLDVPYVPTPQPVVDEMLEIAQVEPGDYVIDLGSGDGRIVIAAAKKGATGHGVDLDPDRISEARENAVNEDVDDKVMFLRKNIFDTDISQASVITMYLLSSVNLKLRPTILKTLRPGTRVVSHSFDMGDWRPDGSFDVESSMGRGHDVYLWVVPADASGTWSWNVDGRSHTLEVSQRYQEIGLELESEGNTLDTSDRVLRGRRISFSATDGDRHYLYSGRIEGNRITGTVQIRTGNSRDNDQIVNWKATR